jgi:hypothetical protein
MRARRSAAPLLFLALATAACGSRDDGAPAPRLQPEETPAAAEAYPAPPLSDYDREIVERTRAEEAEHLPRGGIDGVVRTAWDRLEITARDGTRRVFTDSLDGGNVLWVHVFQGRAAPADAFLVERRLVPEGWDFLLVEAANGRTTLLDFTPVASPDGRRLVTASQDLVAGYLPNRIRVYRMEPAGPVLEWEHEPRTWGAQAAVWEDARTIRLSWSRLTDGYEVDDQPEPLFLDLTPAGWTLRSAPPADG